MDDNDGGLGIGSTGKNLSKAFKEGALFASPDSKVGGTGYAPNADNVKPVDNTDDLQKIAEGADPEAVKRQAEAARRAKIYNPRDYENRRSQSVVYSQREITEQQLAEVRARNEAAMREQQRIATGQKIERGSFKVAIWVFVAILVISAIALVVVIIASIRHPVTPPEPSEPEKPEVLSIVDGYSCKTQACNKVADLPDGRILLRDEAYFTYDVNTKELIGTTIDAGEYIEVEAFDWNGKTYITLNPATGSVSLFSLNDNHYVNKGVYDEYYISIDDSVYNGMHQVFGDYIVARLKGELKLIDLSDGSALVSGTTRVFVHDGFYFGYQGNSGVYVYSRSKTQPILNMVQNGDNRLYTKEGRLIEVKDGNILNVYDTEGNELLSDPIKDDLLRNGYENFINYITNKGDFYQIPTA